MNPSDQKFILRINGKKKTGGPTATFQLAKCLKNYGLSVTLLYDDDQCYEYFKDWHIKYLEDYSGFWTMESIYNIKNSIVILNDTSTSDINKLSNSNTIWLYMQSVDNCILFGTRASRFEGSVRILKNCFKDFRKSYTFRWNSISDRIQLILTQSSYGNDFHSRLNANIPYFYIGDFIDHDLKQINKIILNNLSSSKIIISYNPVKGKILFKICKFFARNIEFKPVQGITSENLQAYLASSDCYVDFGGLPGKDRLPREATVAGIPSFFFKRGAGVNGTDFPCVSIFKLGFIDCLYFEKKIRMGLLSNSNINNATRLCEIAVEKEIFYLRVRSLLIQLNFLRN
jgi:hypothetical protein